MSERYEVQETYDCGDCVVDTAEDGRIVCASDSCEAPEDASVYRAFAPLLDECNALATRLAAARSDAARLARERDEARARANDLKAALTRVAEMLGKHGCSCECGHGFDEHGEDCNRCWACRVESAMEDRTDG